MTLLAGTARGVFALTSDGAELRLASRGVRDLHRSRGRVYASTGAGLFCSADDGATFTDGGLDDREVWQVRGDGAGTLYAGCQPAGLFRSDDGGQAWTAIDAFTAMPEAAQWCVPVEPRLPGRARTIVVDPRDPRRLWVGVEVGGIARSADGGRTWQLTLPGDNPDLHNLCMHPACPDVLFATTGYGRLDGVAPMVEGNAGVFRSDDGGTSWQYAWHGITPRYSRPLCIDPRPPHALTVASAPNAFSSARDPGGAGAALLRSDDHGRSWRALGDAAHAPSAANFHGLCPDPANIGGVLVGTDTGEVWRVGADARWQLLASGLPAVLALLDTATDA